MSEISVVVLPLKVQTTVRDAFERWCEPQHRWPDAQPLKGLGEVIEQLKQVQAVHVAAAGRNRWTVRVDTYPREMFAATNMAEELTNLLDCVIFVSPTDFKKVRPALQQTSHDVTYYIVNVRAKRVTKELD